MNFLDIAGAVAGVAVISGALADWNFRHNPSKAAEGHLLTIAAAAQCPSHPDAGSRAERAAYAYAFTHPADLPPWRVFQVTRNLPPPMMPDNIFAAAMCQSIASGID